MKKLYSKIIKSISKGLNESGLFNDIDLDSDELTLDELNIADKLSEYVDLGLPSGTLWCTHNIDAKKPEDYGIYATWEEANKKFELPTKLLILELIDKCIWKWHTINNINGYLCIGSNKKHIFFPAGGYKHYLNNKRYKTNVNHELNYWSSSKLKKDDLPHGFGTMYVNGLTGSKSENIHCGYLQWETLLGLVREVKIK